MRLQIAWALAHFLWQGAAIAVLLWILLQVLRDAKLRYNACAVALTLMCASPVATLFWLAPRTLTLRETGGPILDTALPGSGASSVGWFETNASWLFWLWIAGALVLLARAATAWWRARRLVSRDFEPMPGSVELAALRLARQLGARRVQFRASARVASALVFGWLKPIVVLPGAVLGRLTEAEIEALLAHELAHVIRCDFFVNLLQIIAECMLFYHPLVWWVSARMREERELCCDDIAVAVCRDEVLYSRALLRLEELRMEPALAATGGHLAHRIRRLLAGPESGSTSVLSVAPGLALVLLLGLSVALLAQNAPPAPPAPPAAPPPPPAQPVALHAPSAPPPPDGSTRSKTVYRAGGDVSRPRLVYKIEPEYTKEAQDRHLEGPVALSIVVSPEGSPTDIKVVRSLDQGLDRKALEAVSRWKFEPGRQGGKPVPVVANIEINFRLLDDPPPVAPVPPAPPVAPAPAVAPRPRVSSVPAPSPEPAVAPEPPEPPAVGEALPSPPTPPAPPSNGPPQGVSDGVRGGVVEGIDGGVVTPSLGGVDATRARLVELQTMKFQASAVGQAASQERADAARARQAAEARLREDMASARVRAANDPELQRSVEDQSRQALSLARPELEKAKAEQDKVGQVMRLAQRERDASGQSVARASADRMQQLAKLKSEADRSGNSNQAELERRRQYAAEHFGGESTDRGKVYMHYGPPDELESHPSQGKGVEIWRYKDASKAKVTLEIEFQEGKQVRRTGRFAAEN